MTERPPKYKLVRKRECRKCGKELELSGFENDEEEKRVNIYACVNDDCPKKGDQIRPRPKKEEDT